MESTVKGIFKITSWNKKPVDKKSVRKIAQASVSKFFECGINGEEVLEYIMMYRDDGFANFVGLE